MPPSVTSGAVQADCQLHRAVGCVSLLLPWVYVAVVASCGVLPSEVRQEGETGFGPQRPATWLSLQGAKMTRPVADAPGNKRRAADARPSRQRGFPRAGVFQPLATSEGLFIARDTGRRHGGNSSMDWKHV